MHSNLSVLLSSYLSAYENGIISTDYLLGFLEEAVGR